LRIILALTLIVPAHLDSLHEILMGSVEARLESGTDLVTSFATCPAERATAVAVDEIGR
jgi:hypothetical protein